MITDDELLAPVRESLAVLHMRTSVDDVIKTGRSRRRRRQAILTGALATTATAATLIGTTIAGPHSAPQPRASHPIPAGSTPPPVVSAQPVAFTVTSAADGTTTLKIYKGHYLDPAALRQAFAQHGIPAIVTVGEFCRSQPEPALVGGVLIPQNNPDGYLFTINPAAIPPGARLSVGYFGNAVRFGLVSANATADCTNGTQPAAHASVSSGKIR
jgi:hypothetical protein